MQLKRRAVLAAAASSVAALATNIRASSGVTAPGPQGGSPMPSRPYEFDIAEPVSAAHWADQGADMFARLEEMYPADPGELSGCALFVFGGGQHTCFNVDISHTPQRDGFPRLHNLGYLDVEELRQLTEQAREGEHFVAALREMYPHARPAAYSGATLNFFSGANPEMRLYMGSHCLGVLRGPALAGLLECARIRLALEVK
jgi:hypothetical protein